MMIMGRVSPVVFVSCAEELELSPRPRSFAAAAYAAVRDSGCRVAAPSGSTGHKDPPAEERRRQVGTCDVYLGLIGREYGSQVVDLPSRSYLELEYAAAQKAGLHRIVFVRTLETESIDGRQQAFRERARQDGLCGWFVDDEELHRLARIALEGWRSRSPKRAARKRARQDPPGIGPACDANGLKDWAPEIASGISDAIGWP